MTLQVFYERMFPIVEEFAKEVNGPDSTADQLDHAACVIACMLMSGINHALQDDPRRLRSLVALVGAYMIGENPNVLINPDAPKNEDAPNT